MPKEYDNELRGVLFKNDRKESDNHPDYKGTAQIDGTEYWLSAWIKEGQKGKFMSLSFKAKDGNAVAPSQQKAKPAAKPANLDDDIPFAQCHRGALSALA